MGIIQDAWDDLTGKTAAREAQEQAKQDRQEAETRANRQRVFAETEGQGKGSIGTVSLGIDDEELNPRVKRKANTYL